MSEDGRNPVAYLFVRCQVPGTDGDALLPEKASDLKIRRSHCYAHRLGFVTPRYNAAVVRRKHDDRAASQFGPIKPFAAHEKIVAVAKGKHFSLPAAKPILFREPGEIIPRIRVSLPVVIRAARIEGHIHHSHTAARRSLL
jgi:hypothetical protein